MTGGHETHRLRCSVSCGWRMSTNGRSSASPLVAVAVPAALLGIVLYYRSSKRRRLPATSASWQEHFLNVEEAAAHSKSCSEAVQNGDSVLVLHTLATAEECNFLQAQASRVAAAQAKLAATDPLREWWSVPEAPGRMRLPIDKALDAPSRALCDGLLVRALGRLHATFPSLVSEVFGDSVLDDDEQHGGSDAREPRALCKTLTGNPRIEFSPREPAINVCKSAPR